MFKSKYIYNYTISDLEKHTGLTRRTIHYYTKEKLIPSPDGMGGGAKYSEEHLLRLQLIKEMQKSHLKLSGIKEALDSMSIDELDKLSFKEIDTNIEISYDDDLVSLRRNFVRDILIFNEEIYIVMFNEIIKNKEFYYNTKVIKARIDLSENLLEFNDFFTMPESFHSTENGPVDFTHVGGRIISYKNNNLLLSVPDYGHPNSLKAQDPNSFFGKIYY